MKKIILLILFLQKINRATLLRQKTLLTYSLPENRHLKRLLGYTEDTYLNFTELATKYRYPSEEHTVITEDGYVLKVFRILSKCRTVSERLPIILMHGLFDSSDLWILSGPRTGLAYILANNCYDVWVPNHRGNRYSRKHLTLDPNKDIEYWNFSFDEHGYFDIPAIINYVIEVTNKSKLFYVGHSQGTTDYYVAMSLRPEYNDRIQLSFHLAPVAWLKNIKSPIHKSIAEITTEIKAVLDLLGVGEVFARRQLSHIILEFFCQYAPQLVCGTGLTITTGFLKGTVSSRTLAVAFGHVLAGTSVKSLAHFGQLILSMKFHRYDEGKIGNLKKYGLKKPPEYNISKIVSPVFLICGQNDWLSSLKDVNELSSRLPNLIETYIVPEPYWGHNNYVWGLEAPELIFKKILDYLKRYGK
ncbi:unnamed protein product [Parnassius apollo]|uniref:Lipase n=1 Tax=Parnassius apollo TaxID=110799 RepID=A0A8S3XXZ7_PARAO|nr:unnamed protein product [Parnassius apollo]